MLFTKTIRDGGLRMFEIYVFTGAVVGVLLLFLAGLIPALAGIGVCAAAALLTEGLNRLEP